MKRCSLAVVVALYTGKIIKNLLMFLKEKQICYKMVYFE